MRVFGVVAVVLVAAWTAEARACGPGEFNSSFANRGFGCNPVAANSFRGNPFAFAQFQQQQQISAQRQFLAAQVAARNARLKPMRIAKAQQMREYKLAKREATKQRVARMYQDYKRRQLESGDQVLVASSPSSSRR